MVSFDFYWSSWKITKQKPQIRYKKHIPKLQNKKIMKKHKTINHNQMRGGKKVKTKKPFFLTQNCRRGEMMSGDWYGHPCSSPVGKDERETSKRKRQGE